MPASPTPPFRTLLRDVAALVLLLGLAAAGYGWYRSAAQSRTWQTVEREAEGLRFRLPPGWVATPAGYADPAFRERRAAGLLLTVRSWAIPAEVASAGDGGSPEAAAVAVWAAGQRGRALGARTLLAEREIRVGGERAVLQLFEEPRETLRYSIVAAAARGGRLYTFSARAGADLDRRDALRLVRRILRTVEWLPPAGPPPADAAGGSTARGWGEPVSPARAFTTP